MRKSACVLASLLISLASRDASAAEPHRAPARRPPPAAGLQIVSRDVALCAGLSQLEGRDAMWQGADNAMRRELLAMVVALCLSGGDSGNTMVTAIRLRQGPALFAPGSF